MIVKPFRRFISRFFKFAFFHIISGSAFGPAAAVGHRGELFHCPSEGFHPDLTDCKIFYRCVDWNVNSFGEPPATSLTAFQFACAEGTVFDPDLNVCNHPRDTSRAECGGTRVPLRSGYPVLQFPPQENAGGYFGGGSFPAANETARGTGHFQSGNAYANEYPHRRGDNSKYPWQLDEYQNPDAGPAKASGSCQSEGFFPVEGDCTKFARCVVDGTGRYGMYTFQCGPGTVWDQRNLVCNHPYAVPGCGGTQGYNGQGLMPPESDYDSGWRQPVRENNGYTGTPLEGAYPGVGNQEGRFPMRSYSPMGGNYPYHVDHMTYPQKSPQTYAPESARPEWNANNFQPANYPAMNPDQVHNGNVPYHTTYSEAQFQGKYSQAEYYFTGENFDPYPPQNEYQYTPVSSTHMSYAVTDNETSQAGFPKRPNQSSYPEPGGQSYYPSQGSYPGNYQNRPETSTTVQTYQTKQNEETQIPFSNNPYRPPGQQTEGYGAQTYEGDSYSPQLKEPAEEPGIPEVPSGDSKECHEDGFFSIPGECKKFFRCVDNGKGGYFRYDFNCGEGTVWDQGSTTCNHPWAVKRGDVDCSAEGSPPQTEPNSFYATPTYQTQPQSSGAWSQSSQTATTHAASSYATASSTAGREKAPQSQKPETTWSGGYDQYKSTTVKHKTSSETTSGKETSFQKGKDKPGATTPMTPNKYTVTDNKRTSEMHYHEHGETSTSPPKSTPFQPSDKGKIKCEKAGFYPYPGSCTKFYRCADWDGDKGERFSVYYFECAPGTIWDPALDTCNHEDSVYPPRSCGVEESTEEKRPPTTEESAEEKRPPPTTEESTSAGNESTEVPGTGDYTAITTSSSSDDRTPGEVTTSSDTDTTITTTATTTTTYTSEESSPTTNTEGSTLASTDSTDSETTTVSSTEEAGSTTATTDSAMTTSYESTAPSTTAMTTTEQRETLYTSGKQTETASMSTRVETLFTSVPTTETASDFSTTAESEPADAGEEANATTQSPGEQNPSPGDASPDCPALGDDQALFVCPTGFRRHPRECNNFYQCTVSREGDVNIMILTCQNRTVYDERKIQCLPEDETESCPGKASGKSRQYRRTERETTSTVPVSPSQSLCPQQGNFPYHGDCRKFFKCRTDRKGRMQGFLYQCPENFSFWEASGRCEPTHQLPKCSRFPQDVSSGKLKWMSSKVPVASPGSEVR